MKLKYFDGNNFGDALNPVIFNKILPNFFDDKEDIGFFGIGSIIGFEMMQKAKNKIVFSSGYSPSYAEKYGKIQIDNSYKFYCVRGPLTADALKLEKKLAVTDGAALLREFEFKPLSKKYKVSYMPHWTSEQLYPWEDICAQCDIHYVSPRGSVEHIIEEILQSQMVIAEAMHYAIVADALRVPWIPVKAYSFIDDFKWMDWTASLTLPYNPVHIKPLYAIDERFEEKVNRRLKNLVPRNIITVGKSLYSLYQDKVLFDKNVKILHMVKMREPILSKDAVFHEKTDCLLEILDRIRRDYTAE